MQEVVIGVDVSKDWIDICDGGRTRQIKSTTHSLKRLAKGWAARDAFIIFEATGGYDHPLRTALEAAGVRFSRVNPLRARRFADACGVLAKTDAVDAAMLARMGAQFDLAETPHQPPERRRLQALNARRHQLVEA